LGNHDIEYLLLARQYDALVDGEADALANSANFVGLLNDALQDINWIGLYIVRGNDLVLGPFQGKPACVRIPLGRGVCGTAAAAGETLRVADVHAFAGHIACDPASKSEIVVPLSLAGRVIGVLDIDSPLPDRFGLEDQDGLEMLGRRFERCLSTNGGDFI
jgi:GAF domain-containing protein